MAAQKQAKRRRRNAIKAKPDKTQGEIKYWLCGKVDKTVRHIVCECPILGQREYKRRHDWVDRKIHWEVFRRTGFDVNKNGIRTSQGK